jgi:hypothetical protein
MHVAREVRVTVDEINLRGAIVETLVRGEHVSDLFTLLRYTAPPAFVGAPLHRHAVTAEAFHVVDDELTIELDGEVTVLGAERPGRAAMAGPRDREYRMTAAGASVRNHRVREGRGVSQ